MSDNELAFSIGEYRSRYLAQNVDTVFGKIIKIDLESLNHSIISMGHRNVQGLLYDQNKNILLATEHGPFGGDEINIIHLDESKIPNYGWPIASYGEHYGIRSKNKKNMINTLY